MLEYVNILSLWTTMYLLLLSPGGLGIVDWFCAGLVLCPTFCLLSDPTDFDDSVGVISLLRTRASENVQNFP